MDKKQIDLLNWLLKFRSVDLTNLRLYEFAAYRKIIGFLIVYGTLLKSSESSEWDIDINDSLQKMERNFGSFKIKTEEFASNVDTFPEGVNLLHLQHDFKDATESVFRNIELVKGGAKEEELQQMEPIGMSMSVEMRIMNSESDHGSTSLRFYEFSHADPLELLVYHFFRNLNDAPLDAFNKCPECGHWFLNVSKRTKIYCSSKCASRHIVRKKREDPVYREEEKKKSRKRAQKSYESRIKKKAPNAKITKRPRKK
jgi:hypothetical protein